MDEVYVEYADTVYRYLYTLTLDGDLAEELTQETFYQAIRTIDRFDGSCTIGTWLCAIGKRALQTYRRKHPATVPLRETDRAASETDAALTKIELMKRLHAMDEPYREVMYLRLFGDLSFREIGEIHGKSENWARVAFYRGKERLKKELEDHEN